MNYTTLEDIKEFLKMLSYEWDGYITLANNKKLATIEDIVDYGATLIVKKLNQTETQNLSIFVTDTTFEIEKHNPDKKYDSLDYSVSWQNFMLSRKDKEYARYLYSTSLKNHKETEQKIDTQMNLLREKARRLASKKKLSEAKIYALKHNIKQQLSEEEIKEIERNI